MDLVTAIEKRISVREFSEEPVDITDMKEIIRLAGLAPSIGNLQPWKYYLISNRKLLDKMAMAITMEISKMPETSSRMAKHLKQQAAWFSTFFNRAPMLIALAGQPYETDLEHGVTIPHEELERMKNYPDLQSSGASVQNLLLAATSMGYGTCWMTEPLFANGKIQELLSIEAPWRLISFVAIGKAKKEIKKTREKRNLADEIVIME